MEEKENYLLITRYLSQQTSTAENEYLADWIAASPANELIFQDIKTVWLRSKPIHHPGTERALLQLKSKINAAKPENTVKLKIAKRWYGIAASFIGILILFTVGYKYLIIAGANDTLRQFTKAGQKKTFRLDDGTVVYLAPQSSLSYPSRLDSKTRVVKLTGEAYFEVTKNLHRPFIVHTDKLNVHVLGTHFNVRSSANGNYTTVSLLEGKVNVTMTDDEEEEYALKPGQELSLNHLNHQIYQHDFDTAAVTGWMKNTLIFKNDRLAVAAEKINQLYGVKIIFEDQATADMRLYATFKNESLTTVMETIKATGNVAYRIEGNKVYLTLKH